MDIVYEASKKNYHSPIISAGRKINNDMGSFIADITIKHMINANKRIKGSKVCILGISFKENCPDIRNTRVMDIITRLQEFGVQTIVVDPVANVEDLRNEYGVELVSLDTVRDVDCVIAAVAHERFRNMGIDEYDRLFKKDNEERNVFIDVKSIMNKNMMESRGYSYWSL